jgi:serine/threonine-protein kinase RsbW
MLTWKSLPGCVNVDQSFVLTIQSETGEIPTISSALETAMHNHAFNQEEILDTQLAVEEAITNIIMHGYKGRTGTILISCRATHGLVEVQIEDNGVPFDPLSVPEPDLTGNVEDRHIGGLGIFLIRQVMDEIVYRFENGKNILTLVKRKGA